MEIGILGIVGIMAIGYGVGKCIEDIIESLIKCD